MRDALSNGLPGGERGVPTRILSLYLPRLSTDRLIRRRRSSDAPPEGRALAVVTKLKNALRVVALDERAQVRGLRPGMGLADARGAVPDLIVAEADEIADRALLEEIADWADRYTPLVALDPPDGLHLDISGCAHLFARDGVDGETALTADCLARLQRQGVHARAAIASTIGAAAALARHGAEGCVPAGGEAEALAGLPVRALRIGEETVALLERLGLKRIGQLIGKPRAPLAARFGVPLVRRLDQALGRLDEVLSPRRPAPHFSAERRFAEPVADAGSLLQSIASLAGSLGPVLERQGLGARRLEAAFHRTDGAVIRVVIGTAAPLRAADGMLALFAERLATLGSGWDAGFGFDMVRLAVLHAEPLCAAQIDLSGETGEGSDLTHLYDRLGARLGTARITRFEPRDTHVPERAVRARPLVAATGAAPAWPRLEAAFETPPERPLRMFARPEPVEVMAEVPDGPPLHFRWRRVTHEVVRAEGPERIAPEWWRAEEMGRLTRDYFRVEDAAGRRYWLFREGLYERETARPLWYMHGLFG